MLMERDFYGAVKDDQVAAKEIRGLKERLASPNLLTETEAAKLREIFKQI